MGLRVGKMEIEEIKKKFRTYKKEEIIITSHADMQAYVREIGIDEVKENIVNPEKLVYAREQKAKKPNEKKYDCYFAYSDNLFHRYAVILNRKVIIVTIIKVNRNWQRAVEGRK